MKRIIFGSILAGIMTTFFIIDIMDNPPRLLNGILFISFWYTISGLLVGLGIKSVKRDTKNAKQ